MKKLFKAVGTLGLVGCAVMNSQFAVADNTFWYVGGNIGQSRAKIDDARIAPQLPGPASISDDSKGNAFKLFGGYQFSKNFAVEGGYFNLGQFGYTAATTVPAAGTLSGKLKLQGLNIDAVGMFPLADKFSVFGRLGLQYAQTKDNFSSTGAVPNPTNPDPSNSAANYKYGVGLQYDFNESLGMRAEAERYRIDDAIGNNGDIDLYSVGLVYRFDQKKQEPVRKAATPPPPPPVVVKAPVRVIVPVKVKTEQYCSILDLTFEINRDEIQRDDKEKLAVVGTYMNKYPNTWAVIEGHTDNVGPAEKNMTLSQNRAESVVNYLVDDLHIDRSRLSAVGYGETRPIADNDTNEGKQANRRINAVIACVTDIAGLKVAPAKSTLAMEIEFDPYKSEIEQEYRAGLSYVANFMKANPTITATVEGHASKYLGTDAEKVRVNPELAMKISELRAQNVVNYLADNGVARSRLSTAAYGQTRRVAYGTTLEGQQENRRINIIFSYAK